MLRQTVITASSLPKAYSQGVALKQEYFQQPREDERLMTKLHNKAHWLAALPRRRDADPQPGSPGLGLLPFAQCPCQGQGGAVWLRRREGTDGMCNALGHTRPHRTRTPGCACSGHKQAPTNQLGHGALTAQVKHFQNLSPVRSEWLSEWLSELPQ